MANTGQPNEAWQKTSSKPSSSRSRALQIAASGLFAALSVILASASQAVGLAFPLIPYLQFDFGEVAIILAFLFFGPWPAVASGIVEFLALMVVGQNVPIGPTLKVLAVLSTISGLWLGLVLASKVKRLGTASRIGAATGMGMLVRAAVMTIPNYLLVAGTGLLGTVDYLAGFFKLIGISLSPSNGILLILAFTALFNCLQLALALGIAYLISRLPQLQRSMRRYRLAWFETFGSHGVNSRER